MTYIPQQPSTGKPTLVIHEETFRKGRHLYRRVTVNDQVDQMPEAQAQAVIKHKQGRAAISANLTNARKWLHRNFGTKDLDFIEVVRRIGEDS